MREPAHAARLRPGGAPDLIRGLVRGRVPLAAPCGTADDHRAGRGPRTARSRHWAGTAGAWPDPARITARTVR